MEGRKLKLYEYVDEFIAETFDSEVGATFKKADLKRWRDENEHEFLLDDALQAHRSSPKKRAFTTMRHGMGPHSFYEVVEVHEGRYAIKTVLAMHHQQADEMVSRWEREYVNRMEVVGARSKKGKDYLKLARAEVKAVATLLNVRMMSLLEDEDGESE